MGLDVICFKCILLNNCHLPYFCFYQSVYCLSTSLKHGCTDMIFFTLYRANAGFVVECDNEWHTFAPPSPYSTPGFLDHVSMKQMHPRSNLSCRSSTADTQELSAKPIESSEKVVRFHKTLNEWNLQHCLNNCQDC